MAISHPFLDAFWMDRSVRTLLQNITVPVYLGCAWDNSGVHLPSTSTRGGDCR